MFASIFISPIVVRCGDVTRAEQTGSGLETLTSASQQLPTFRRRKKRKKKEKRNTVTWTEHRNIISRLLFPYELKVTAWNVLSDCQRTHTSLRVWRESQNSKIYELEGQVLTITWIYCWYLLSAGSKLWFTVWNLDRNVCLKQRIESTVQFGVLPSKGAKLHTWNLIQLVEATALI